MDSTDYADYAAASKMQMYSRWILGLLLLVVLVVLVGVAIYYIIARYRAKMNDANQDNNDEEGDGPGVPPATDAEVEQLQDQTIENQTKVMEDQETNPELITKDNEKILADEVKASKKNTSGKVVNNMVSALKKSTKAKRDASAYRPTTVREINGEIILGDLSTSGDSLKSTKVLGEMRRQKPHSLQSVKKANWGGDCTDSSDTYQTVMVSESVSSDSSVFSDLSSSE